MNKRDTVDVCDEYGIVAKKRFSQNFLCNAQLTEKIVDAAVISEKDAVLEIGPGIGALTSLLCQVSGSVVAVEIDPDLVSFLQNQYKDSKVLSVIEGDYLRMDRDSLFTSGRYPSVIISNLPYNVTTPMIIKLLGDYPQSRTMVFMIEEDACERLFAHPKEKAYGALSIIASSYGTKEKLFLVDSDSFFPAPHTRSAVVRFVRTASQFVITDSYMQFLKDAFSQRRKTLINSLSSFPRNVLAVRKLPDILNEMSISNTIRAEALTPEQLISIFSILEQNK